jgi:hypothetical protein
MTASESAPKSASSSALAAAPPTHDRIAEWLLFLPIIGVTFFSKLAIPFGTEQVSIGTPFIVVPVVVGLLLGRMRFLIPNLIAYAAMIVVLLGLQIFSGNDFSYKSLALLVVIHASYLVALRPGLARHDIQLQFYQTVMAIIAVCGIAQFALQFVTDHSTVFPIETKFPDAFVIRNFNYMIPLRPGSAIYKSNGLFLIEPSTFSEYLAISFVIELLLFHRFTRLTLLTLGLVLSYSGSGLVVLGCVLPFMLFVYRRFELLLLAIVVLGVAYVASDALHLDIFVTRAGEFENPNSSAYGRYIGGFDLFAQYLWPNFSNSLFGMGAGAFEHGGHIRSFVSELTWVKMPFEYGLIGACVYFAFMGYCIYSTKQSVFLKSSLTITLVIFTPLVPYVHALILALLIWPSSKPGRTPQTQGHSELLRSGAPSALGA